MDLPLAFNVLTHFVSRAFYTEDYGLQSRALSAVQDLRGHFYQTQAKLDTANAAVESLTEQLNTKLVELERLSKAYTELEEAHTTLKKELSTSKAQVTRLSKKIEDNE